MFKRPIPVWPAAAAPAANRCSHFHGADQDAAHAKCRQTGPSGKQCQMHPKECR